jgi:hypothetical protein
MLIQKCPNLAFGHEPRCTQTRQIAMEGLETPDQGFGRSIIDGKSEAVQSSQAAHQVWHFRAPAEGFKEQEFVIEYMAGPSIRRSKYDLRDFIDPIRKVINPRGPQWGRRDSP